MVNFLESFFRKKYRIILKNEAETPLQALDRLRKNDSTLKNLPMTYAGRLDPMASGQLLILIGDECKKREKYDGLDKEYEVEILFGAESDTADILGLANLCNDKLNFSIVELKNELKRLIGKIDLPYPAFSSKTVMGKPLFHHALENNLAGIEIPTKRVSIYKAKFLGVRKITKDDLINSVISRISEFKPELDPEKIGSDFRKEEILSRWDLLRKSLFSEFYIVKVRFVSSSGSYMRSIVTLLAGRLNTCALAYSIHRTKIGKYLSLSRGFGIWLKLF
jgi:tRNA pseudouridine(55) synthase